MGQRRTERRPEGGRLRDTGPDEIFDPTASSTSCPIWTKTISRPASSPSRSPAWPSSRRRERRPDADATEGGSHTTGVDAVLERLQRRRSGRRRCPGTVAGQQEAPWRDPGRHGPRHREQIESGLARQKTPSSASASWLLEDKTITELDLTRALATKFGIEYLDLTKIQLDMAAAGLLSERLCRRYGAIPVRFSRHHAAGRMIDPANVLVADDLRIMTGYTIVPAIASEEDVYGAIGS